MNTRGCFLRAHSVGAWLLFSPARSPNTRLLRKEGMHRPVQRTPRTRPVPSALYGEQVCFTERGQDRYPFAFLASRVAATTDVLPSTLVGVDKESKFRGSHHFLTKQPNTINMIGLHTVVCDSTTIGPSRRYQRLPTLHPTTQATVITTTTLDVRNSARCEQRLGG